MNRTNEYNDLLSELEHTPPALEQTVIQARARAKSRALLRRMTLIPLSSATVFFIAFVTLVNVSLTFAAACGQIPLLRELARAVAFSPSLSAAVENEFVQPIELEQTVNGVSARIEYVIVDQKQLNVFYSLKSDTYSDMDAWLSIESPDGQTLESYGIIGGPSFVENGGLRHITVDFLYDDMPGELILYLRVRNIGSDSVTAPAPAKDDILFNPQEYTEPAFISEFKFLLDFDPEYTQQCELIALNRQFDINGQGLTVTTVEIYPTHIRVNLEDDAGNTAWLKSISFYLENEKGELFETISNGISATGTVDSPMMDSYRLESSFFSKSRELTLYITGATWLDKDMERVKINLSRAYAEELPESVTLRQAEKKNGGWQLTFSAPELEENSTYQLFMSGYYSETGIEFSINSWVAGGNSYLDAETGEYAYLFGEFIEQFALVDYPYDVVWLTPAFSHRTTLDKPVSITVR